MKKRMVCVLLAVLTLLTVLTPVAHAQQEGGVWTLLAPDGSVLTRIAAAISVGDEYIASDNRSYRVTASDPDSRTATAEEAGMENPVAQAFYTARRAAANARRIGLYCTHSDESYENGDGTASNEQGWSGIHDVAATLKSWLEKKGIQVDFNTDSFLPHDAGAYRRSRRAMTELVRAAPDAVFDVHRDGIPDSAEYETEIDGKKATRVRLLVGRSNPNSAENKQFAVKLKSVADAQYPGLIKDIFIGKGNYNQELMPDSVLLEFGTHTSDKQQVLASTEFMADVISMTLFGTSRGYTADSAEKSISAPDASETAPSQNPSDVPKESEAPASRGGSGIWIAIAIILGVAAAGLILFMLLSGGNLGDRLRKFSSEITGGWLKNRKEK